MEHAYDLANQGYDLVNKTYTLESLYVIMDYSNLSKDNYRDILLHQNIDEEFIKTYIDKFKDYLYLYAYHFKLSDEFIRYLFDNDIMTLDTILNQELSEDTLRYIFSRKEEIISPLLNGILKTRNISHDFIMLYLSYIDFEILFKYQNISEEFCNEIFIITGDDKKLHTMFSVGAVYQRWSDDFIIRFKDYVDWFKYYIYPERVLLPYNKTEYFIDDEGIGYFPDNIEWPILTDPEDPRVLIVNNKNVTPQEWKIKIQAEYHTYDLTDDYFVGYMACYKDGYSLEDFSFKFENGNIYELHSDITNTPDSFGFKIVTLSEAKAYKDDVRLIKPNMKKVILVKVYFEDVSYAHKTTEGYEIRAEKIEVLNDYYGL